MSYIHLNKHVQIIISPALAGGKRAVYVVRHNQPHRKPDFVGNIIRYGAQNFFSDIDDKVCDLPTTTCEWRNHIEQQLRLTGAL